MTTRFYLGTTLMRQGEAAAAYERFAEILPIAREAHERLQFANVKPLQEDDGRIVASGDARERLSADGPAYRDWTKSVVREELHKAGWRLADLLEKILRSTSVATAMASVASAQAGSNPNLKPSAADYTRQSSYGEFPAITRKLSPRG